MNEIVVYTEEAVIPSERSESRDLRISLRFWVNLVRRSFDSLSLAQDDSIFEMFNLCNKLSIWRFVYKSHKFFH